MHTDCWIQQVTTRVGAVTCWIQQSVSPKQVVGFTCVFNSEIDQLIRKSSVIQFTTSVSVFVEAIARSAHTSIDLQRGALCLLHALYRSSLRLLWTLPMHRHLCIRNAFTLVPKNSDIKLLFSHNFLLGSV